ncbi:MAG TPA: glycosyltransferase family 4 protein, partial [Nitrososphaeraceae archaeon]|nr:glycosyltransferase family 4 protein [Nitrososphaeraceae archaeon]
MSVEEREPQLELSHLSILLVSPEYPPMPGGVGRYTHNLKTHLARKGVQVSVVCDSRCHGDYSGISQHNPRNSEVLLEIVERLNPDLIHVQYEPGLYGLKLDPLNPARSCTNIDSFYEHCKVPIITTFHSVYPFGQWMNLPIPNYELVTDPPLLRKIKHLASFWTRLINYRSFLMLNRRKLAQSVAGIAFSEFTSQLLGSDGKCHMILHGAEKQGESDQKSKTELRDSFSISDHGRVALALGYATKTKGWDIIEKMPIPDGWTIVVNGSRNEYSHETPPSIKERKNLVILHKDSLNEEQLGELFSCADAVILPYKVGTGSGIMFDGLSYGLPFVATNLGFFKEFASKGLGITVKRKAAAFSRALQDLDLHYEEYSKRAAEFRKNISWQEVATRHAQL